MKKTDNTRIKRIICLLIADTVFIGIASFLAVYTRCEYEISLVIGEGYLHTLMVQSPLIIAVTLISFCIFKLYSSLWEFAGSREVILILAATGCATTVIALVMLFITGYHLPRSFPMLFFVILSVIIILERFSYRHIRKMKNFKLAGRRKRTMIIGGGRAGYLAIREFDSNPNSQNKPVVIIDDDPAKKKGSILGVTIAGGMDTLLENVSKYKIEEIIIAIPSLSVNRRKEVIDLCNKAKVKVKTLPSIAQLANGDVSLNKIRDISIEDILGRDEIDINTDEVSTLFKNKVVLVTGGGGSIGSELCRQIAGFTPKTLIVLDIYENSVYSLQRELSEKYPELDLRILIASVRDKARLESIFATLKPDIVYHAAAHKHVPLMEDSPAEAIKNNVLGTYNVADCCDRYGVSAMVLVSTDKAVRPTNVMGASKRICEMIVQMYDRKSDTKYSAVRFGNVMGSNGSVVPLFKKQIAEGGPVTVTHKDIIRYFMTIPEAVSLILQSGAYAGGGEIFVLDMGEPVKIDDLARNMIKLSGFEPDVDIPIVYTGLRPGEKLYEEMLLEEEGLKQTTSRLIYIGQPIEMDDDVLENWLVNCRKFIESDENHFVLSETVKVGDKNINLYSSDGVNSIKELIREIVPEYDAGSYVV